MRKVVPFEIDPSSVPGGQHACVVSSVMVNVHVSLSSCIVNVSFVSRAHLYCTIVVRGLRFFCGPMKQMSPLR